MTEGFRSIVALDDLIRRWKSEIERRILASGRASGLVGEMNGYHLATGGKRIRAFLPVWVCQNLGGLPENALDIGAGLELLHNATLVHDDIQDGDTHRRGFPTVWKRWGIAQAINAGDALVFQALERIHRAPASRRVAPLVCEAMVRLIEGQAMDMQLHLPENDPDHIAPTSSDWIDMARRKTGALFAACFQAGARAAHAPESTIQSLGELGELFGLLFQVQDDLLDIVGEKGRTARGRDLVAGKVTFPVIWVFEHAPRREVAALKNVLSCKPNDTTEEMVDDAIAILERTGALTATAKWLQAKRDEALRHPFASIVPDLFDRIS